MSTNSKKVIGQGLQFRVYRVGRKRVLKKSTTHAEKLATLKKWKLKRGKVAQEAFARKTVQTLDRSLRGLRKIISKVDPALLGYPKFLRHPSYEQDYILPLGAYLERHSLSENKRIIEAYAENIIQTWRAGFADMIFNFTVNCGVVGNRVVLLDLGELTFSKNKIRAQIKKKDWLKQSSYTSLTDQKLKAYFRKVMDKKITARALDRYWNC